MVHADAANFKTGISKQEAYAHVLEQAAALFDGQRNWVCNLANTASLLHHLYHSLPAPSNAVNWAGFYVLDPSSSSAPSSPSLTASPNGSSHKKTTQRLILGPFMGKVACQTIAVGRGVCGTAAQQGRTVLVPDVLAFPGHIACDGESASEIVVPVLQDGKVVAIIDIDCAEKDGFDDVDKHGLEAVAELLARSCDF